MLKSKVSWVVTAAVLCLGTGSLIMACGDDKPAAQANLKAAEPTVKVEAPDKPIVINLNVKIEQEVRVKVDRDVDTLLQNNPDLF